MHECFPKHPRMGTARMKQDKKTDEKGKKRGVRMERSKAGTKESPDGLNSNVVKGETNCMPISTQMIKDPKMHCWTKYTTVPEVRHYLWLDPDTPEISHCRTPVATTVLLS